MRVGVGIGVAVGLGCGTGVAVGAGSGVAVGVTVGVGVSVGVTVGVGVAVAAEVGVGVGVGVASGVGVAVGTVVAVGCCCSVVEAGCAGVDTVDSGGVGVAMGVDVMRGGAVAVGGGSLPQAASVIARAISVASNTVVLSIIRLPPYAAGYWSILIYRITPTLTLPLKGEGILGESPLIIQLGGACGVGEGVVVGEGPVDGLDQGAAVVCAAEAVVAAGDGAACQGAGG